MIAMHKYLFSAGFLKTTIMAYPVERIIGILASSMFNITNLLAKAKRPSNLYLKSSSTLLVAINDLMAADISVYLFDSRSRRIISLFVLSI